MPSGDTIKNFTAADIERYHNGQLSAAERHAIEKAALEDPFLADALEGYDDVPTDIKADLSDLQDRLQKRTKEKNNIIPIAAITKKFQWWKVAAIFVIIGGSGWASYQLLVNQHSSDVAKVETKKETSPVVLSPASNDTIQTEIQNSLVNKSNNQVTKELTKENNGTASVNEKTITINSSAGNKSADSNNNAKTDDLDKQETVSVASAPASLPKNFNASEFKKTNENNALADYKQNDKADYYSNAKGFVNTSAANSITFKKPTTEKLNIFRGRVTDANNNPLPFANISNTHDNVGTYSDAKGYFALVSSDSVLNVQVKSVGFENKVTNLKPATVQNKITLQPDTKSVSSLVLSNTNNSAKRKAILNKSTVEEPEPADGWVNYDTYIANNLAEPDNLKPKANATGEVQVSFDVNEYGDPVNIKVDKSLSKACDAEAIRLIKEGPKWKNNGKKRVTISIPFSNN